MTDDGKFAAMWSMGFGNMNDALFRDEESCYPKLHAIKSDWKTHRMPRTCSHIDIDILLTQEEFEVLAWGHIPTAMEDHWFMYFDGDAFCFYRSWTGICIYQVHVKRTRDGYTLYCVTINRNKKQYAEESDERDAVLVSIIVGQALGKDVSELWEQYFALSDE